MGRRQFMNAFGRGDAINSPRIGGSSVEALNRMNAFVMNRIHNNNDQRFNSWHGKQQDPLAIIEGLYLSTRNCFPELDEITTATSAMTKPGNSAPNLQWAR
jgi:hypothetical protein